MDFPNMEYIIMEKNIYMYDLTDEDFFWNKEANVYCKRMQHVPKKRYSSYPNLYQCSYHTIRVLEIYKNAWKNYGNRIFG